MKLENAMVFYENSGKSADEVCKMVEEKRGGCAIPSSIRRLLSSESEYELRAKLQLASGSYGGGNCTGAPQGHAAGRGTERGHTGHIEVRMVNEVEGLKPELQLNSLG
jgi:hypothetical protein